MRTVRHRIRSLGAGVRQWVPRRRGMVAVGCAALLVASLLQIPIATAGASAADVPARYLQQQVTWGDCSWWNDEFLQFGYKKPECASVTVPRDWANPGSGPDLTIAISRVRATDSAHRKGSLFTNPGGPGGTGIDIPSYLASVDGGQRVAADYDLIGMDPRGVGGAGTTPLNCDLPVDLIRGPDFDSRDMSPAAVAEQQKFAKGVADSCAANPLTQYINTWQTTHDMDLIRALLGEQKLNYLGYSYGTWLGAKYAALFPQNTGRMVLDSNTDWMDSMADTFDIQPLGFQRRFRQQFAPWSARQFCPECARIVGVDDDFKLGDTADQVYATYEKVRAAAAKVSGLSARTVDAWITQELYSEEAGYGFLFIHFLLWLLKSALIDHPSANAAAAAQTSVQPLFDKFLTILPDQTRELVKQDFKPTFGVDLDKATLGSLLQPPSNRITGGLASVAAAARTSAGTDSDTFAYNDVFDAVRCGDDRTSHSPDWNVNNTRKYGPAYPLIGYANVADVCAYWSVPRTPLPNPDPNKVTLVTVQSELDPATPYEATSRNLAQFHGARLVSVNDGGDHGQALLDGNECVDDAVNAYLVDGVDLPAQTACTGPRLWREQAAFVLDPPDPRESQVYPVVGPLDGKGSPKSVSGALNAGETQRLAKLSQLIGNTGGGQRPDLAP